MTIATMVSVSYGTPWAPSISQAVSEMTVANSSRMISGSANWRRNFTHSGTGRGAGSGA